MVMRPVHYRGPSWLAPEWCLGVVLLIILGSRFSLDSCESGGYVCGEEYLLGVFCMLFAICGALISTHIRIGLPAILPPQGIRFETRFLELSFVLVMLAYFFWFLEVILNFGLVVAILKGDALNVRGAVNTIPGLTTFTQVGVFYLITFWFLKIRGHQLPVRFMVYFFAVLALGLVRAFLWSERIALVELLVVIAVVHLAFSVRGKFADAVWASFPFFVAPLALLVFAAGEYFRSWNRIAYLENDSFGTYAFERMIEYYSSAQANGISLLKFTNWPTYDMYFTLSGLKNIPILRDMVTPDGSFNYFNHLLAFRSIEFNNPSGVYSVIHDLGYLSFLFFFLFGVFSKRCFQRMKIGDGIGVFMYPIVLLTILELPRYFYLGSIRGLVFLFWVFVFYFLRSHFKIRLSRF